MKKQIISPEVFRPNGIFEILTILKSTFLLICFDPYLRDPGPLVCAMLG